MIATLTRHVGAAPAGQDRTLRLDLLANPYAPAPAARKVLAFGAEPASPSDRLQSILTARLARKHQVPMQSIILSSGASDLLRMFFESFAAVGPLHVFPPSDDDTHDLARQFGCDLVVVPRDRSFHVGALDRFDRSSPSSTAYVMSPNDPTGTQLQLQQAVQLARTVSRIVIDERHAGYAPRDHLPLCREFENVILVRSLEAWGGLTKVPLAYAIASPMVAAEFQSRTADIGLDPASLLAGIATLESCRYLDASARQIARERTDMIRGLRKLNMVRPLPSAANFLLVRVERGERADLRRHLEEREITVHYPCQPGLQDTIRVSAVSQFATRSLTGALIDWAAGL